MPKVIEPANKDAILLGREAVDAYRAERARQHRELTGRAVHDNREILETLVSELEKLGYTSTYTDFEPKKTEVLQKFFDASDLQNIKEIGFKDTEDFEAKATETDREALEAKWR